MSFVGVESQLNDTLPSFSKVRRLERKTQLLISGSIDIQIRHTRVFNRDVDLAPCVCIADYSRFRHRKATRKPFRTVTISFPRSIHVICHEPASNAFVKNNNSLSHKHWTQLLGNRSKPKESIQYWLLHFAPNVRLSRGYVAVEMTGYCAQPRRMTNWALDHESLPGLGSRNDTENDIRESPEGTASGRHNATPTPSVPISHVSRESLSDARALCRRGPRVITRRSCPMTSSTSLESTATGASSWPSSTSALAGWHGSTRVILRSWFYPGSIAPRHVEPRSNPWTRQPHPPSSSLPAAS